MAELSAVIDRINELRQKEYAGEGLNDDEIREAFTLLADVRSMRAGKTPDKTEAKPKVPDVSAEDYF